MGDEFKIQCHECNELTYVQAESLPEYCPMCGRRAEAGEAGDHCRMPKHRTKG